MNRIVAIVILLVAAAALAFAGSSSRGNSGISVGGGTVLDSYKSGGFGEFGFTLYENGGLSLRDYLSVTGYGTSTGSNGIVSLADKVTFGGAWSSSFDTYTFVAGGLGLFSGPSKPFFATPLLWSVEGGGGLQIDLSKRFAYFVELGGGADFATSDRTSYPGPPIDTGYAEISMGLRQFF